MSTSSSRRGSCHAVNAVIRGGARQTIRSELRPATIRDFQYLHGADPGRVSPDGYTLDISYMARPRAEEIQLDLILDYRGTPIQPPSWAAAA